VKLEPLLRIREKDLHPAVELPGVSLVRIGMRLQQDLQSLVVAEMGTERHQGQMLRQESLRLALVRAIVGIAVQL